DHREAHQQKQCTPTAHSNSHRGGITLVRDYTHRACTSTWGLSMNRSLAVLLLLAALTSCRDYDLHSRLTNQDGLVPADRFAGYGQEQAEEMAIARQLGSVMKGSS